MRKKTTMERVKSVQRRLGLEDDGIVGPVTLSRIESLLDEVLGPSDLQPEHNLVVSRKGLDQLMHFEISSESYYRNRLSRPIWPRGASGITIGVGYDLGYNSKAQIRRDWGGRLSDVELEELVNVAGKKGEQAEDALSSVRHIRIPLEAAKQVFFTSAIPEFAHRTREAYPGIRELPADAQTMLLSLVYNRGTRMSGSRRKEMKAIQPLVINKDLDGIAEQIRAMKRLWDISVLPGLHIRRDDEAYMIANARREYDPSELISV
ncbi:MAG: hypothetical protein JRJ86_10300 [Deltaproteobacteria bacterium]|nr:hypothetical protein [Deltaproteobacteria bacterium]